CHHAGGVEAGEDLPRMRGLRLIDHAGIDMADVEIDRKTKQQQLQGRNAKDHAEGDAVAAQLAQLLDHDREQSREIHAASARPSLVAATNTSSRFGVTASMFTASPSGSRRRSAASFSEVAASTRRS